MVLVMLTSDGWDVGLVDGALRDLVSTGLACPATYAYSGWQVVPSGFRRNTLASPRLPLKGL